MSDRQNKTFKESMNEVFVETREQAKGLSPADVAEGVTSWTVHHCVAAVVVIAVHKLAPATTKKEKIQLYIASRAMSGLVADHAAKRMSKKAYKAVEFIQGLVDRNKTWGEAVDEVVNDISNKATDNLPNEEVKSTQEESAQ